MVNDCLTCCRPLDECPVGFAVGPTCRHIAFCGECALRARKLHNDTRCPICKEDAPWVWITDGAHGSLPPPTPNSSDLCSGGMLFDNDALRDAAAKLESIACSICSAEQPSLLALKTHAHAVHHSFLCDTCVGARPCFMREQRLYSRKELSSHLSEGDAPRGDDARLPPHEKCPFCAGDGGAKSLLLLDYAALSRHLRECHFSCTICERAVGVHGAPRFADVGGLTAHAREEHFLCEEGECRGMHVENAFASALELQFHIMKRHAGGRRSRRQARQINGALFGGASGNRRGEIRSHPTPQEAFGAPPPQPPHVASSNIRDPSTDVVRSQSSGSNDPTAVRSEQVDSGRGGGGGGSVALTRDNLLLLFLEAMDKAMGRRLTRAQADPALPREVTGL